MPRICNAASNGMTTEEVADQQFIKRVVQDLTQSCALPLPFPADSIPPLILQAAQFFWENDDNSVIQKYYGVRYKDICKNGFNRTVKLPCQILAVDGVHKLRDNYNFGSVMGDFSIERMVLNNSIMASGVGGSMSDMWGNGQNWNLEDIMVSLYEISTYKQMFSYPVSYNFNPYSNELSILGEVRGQDLLLQCWERVRIQHLYRSYDFFRFVVCLAKEAMATVIGTYQFKLPGGVQLNYDAFRQAAQSEREKIEDRIMKSHSPYTIFMTTTV